MCIEYVWDAYNKKKTLWSLRKFQKQGRFLQQKKFEVLNHYMIYNESPNKLRWTFSLLYTFKFTITDDYCIQMYSIT